MTYIVLARHGQSTWNLEGKIQGQYDCPLTPKGVRQARALGEQLKNLDFQIDAVHSSGLIRAYLTALLAIRHVNPAAPITLHDELKERNWGKLQGQVGEDIKGERDRCLAWDAVPPGGESFIRVDYRTGNYLEKTALPLLREGQNLLCMSHAGPLATLQCRIEGLPWNHPDVGTPNAGARIYELVGDTLILKRILNPN